MGLFPCPPGRLGIVRSRASSSVVRDERLHLNHSFVRVSMLTSKIQRSEFTSQKVFPQSHVTQAPALLAPIIMRSAVSPIPRRRDLLVPAWCSDTQTLPLLQMAAACAEEVKCGSTSDVYSEDSAEVLLDHRERLARARRTTVFVHRWLLVSARRQ